MRLILDAGLVNPETELFDYGCGRGEDVDRLRGQGIRCNGWDPVHFPD